MAAGPRITLVRRIKASPEALFEAWTTPSLMAHWWCGAGAKHIVAQCSPRRSGNFLVSGHSAKGEAIEDWGVYTVVIPGEVLEFSWHAEPPGPSHVTMQLLPLAYTTEITLVHFELPDAETCAMQKARWEAALDALEALVDPPAA
ncbi:SRPBCC domain-containing protein [Sphingomonas canadensis]|uniref:SRPBCC domain-containing protein n=1 Tax=Sphingomonas canadensis TaxID=1219257 RepID=A0ABW3HB76_9SPHN|nr:SRPBCC domain-containing protein [Sphingomonas canadensis]MCW3838357.1 SRPBCC domain-containing protein [Sphingomonas canadensis]